MKTRTHQINLGTDNNTASADQANKIRRISVREFLKEMRHVENTTRITIEIWCKNQRIAQGGDCHWYIDKDCYNPDYLCTSHSGMGTRFPVSADYTLERRTDYVPRNVYTVSWEDMQIKLIVFDYDFVKKEG